jgi:hypothetical protein
MKTPFKHRCIISFTSIKPMTQDEVFEGIVEGLDTDNILKYTIDIEEWDEPEPGDPNDII